MYLRGTGERRDGGTCRACPMCCCDGRAISEGAALCMCVVRARGAHLSRHQPAVEKCKCLRVYPKNVHQPWPLALKYRVGGVLLSAHSCLFETSGV